jgi:hypothetical protein
MDKIKVNKSITLKVKLSPWNLLTLIKLFIIMRKFNIKLILLWEIKMDLLKS